jgi:hypothetical protein
MLPSLCILTFSMVAVSAGMTGRMGHEAAAEATTIQIGF